jgi:hypothetical protein
MTDNEVSLRHYIETLLRDYKEAHAREHQMLDDGLKLARQNTEYRLENLNNWKAQNQDERATLVSRELFDSNIASLRNSMGIVEKAQANLQGRNTQTAIVLGVVFTVVQIALRFLKL